MFKVIIVVSLILQLINAKRNFVVTVDTIACKSNRPDYVDHFHCTIVERKKRNYSNVFLRLKKPLHELNLLYSVEVYPHKMPNFTFLNTPIKGCDFLEAAHKNRYFALVVRNIKKFINEMPRCPLRALFNYSITDYYLDENDFPPGTPECKYRSAAYFTINGQEAASLISDGAIKYHTPRKTG